MNLSILRYCLSIPKCSIYRRYRLKVLRREFCFEFGHVPEGVDCFFHSTGKKFVVSRLESGGQIAEDPDSKVAIKLAEFRLADKGRMELVLQSVRDQILNSGHLYPVNPVPA